MENQRSEAGALNFADEIACINPQGPFHTMLTGYKVNDKSVPPRKLKRERRDMRKISAIPQMASSRV